MAVWAAWHWQLGKSVLKEFIFMVLWFVVKSMQKQQVSSIERYESARVREI